MSIDPVSLFAIKSALEVGTAVASFATMAGQADAQEEINNRAASDSLEAARLNYDQLAAMNEQSRAAAEQEIMENDREALRSTEMARAAASEAGVTGLSVDALIRDMYGKQARFRDTVNVNLENQQRQIEFEKRNVSASTQSQLNSLPPVEPPNFMGLALRAGTGIFGAYKDHLKVKNP